MKTIFYIIILLGAAIVGYVYLSPLFLTSTDTQNTPEEVPQDEADTSESGSTTTLAQLRTNSSPQECTVTYRDEVSGAAVNGTYYFSNNRYYGEVAANEVSLGGEITYYVIDDLTTLYLWSEIGGEFYGVKVTDENKELLQNQQPITESTAITAQCRDWQVDQTVYEPPSDILFSDAASIQAEYGTVYESEDLQVR